MNSANASASWWEGPYRIVQTNLRLTDATLDPDRLAAEVLAFGATAVTFNVGGIYAFYPTQLALHARNPLLDRDLTGDMLEASHKAGLKMVGRFDLSKGTRIAYEAHPEWFVHNAAGKPQEYNGTYQACVNGGWAKDYALQILAEALDRYDLDAAFFNMTGYQPVDYSGTYRGICWCNNCQSGFADMFGRKLPEKEDFSDPSYRDYLLFKDRTSRETAQRVYDTVKSRRPGTGVMGSGRGPNDFLRLELQRAVKRPAPEWPHQAGELSRWAAAFGQGKRYACASTNFLDYNWRYASETPAHHMLRFGQQIASGAQIDYYLLGTFDQENRAPLQPVKEFMHWHAANEGYLVDTKSVARVALYHSRATALRASATTTGKQQVNGFRGAYRALLEARIPFDFVSDERLADADALARLQAYDALFLPNVACISDSEAAILDAYVEQGGTLIATGETGRYDELGRLREALALKSLPADRIVFSADDLETYFRGSAADIGQPDTELLHLHGWYFHTAKKKGVQEVLRLLPSPKYGPPELCFDEFAATAHPGVMSHEHGRGRAVFLPWLPEWLYFRDGLPEHRQLVARLIEEAAPPIAKVVGAGPIEITVRARDNGAGRLVIHIVNYAGQRGSAYEEPPLLTGLRLGVRNATGMARALVAGKTAMLSAPTEDGYVWIDLPDIKYFEVIAFEDEEV